MNFPFRDRISAGRLLAKACEHHANQADTIIVALPRGGIPVACEMSKILSLPLDVLSVRKLGAPGDPELAMGAIACGNVVALNDDIVSMYQIQQHEIDRAIEQETIELERRQKVYRGDRPFPELKKHTVILVDDGIATGATMKAAIQAIRKNEPAKIVVATPVAAPDSLPDIRHCADEVICLHAPDPFMAVGCWYNEFPQASDEKVLSHLSSLNKP